MIQVKDYANIWNSDYTNEMSIIELNHKKDKIRDFIVNKLDLTSKKLSSDTFESLSFKIKNYDDLILHFDRCYHFIILYYPDYMYLFEDLECINTYYESMPDDKLRIQKNINPYITLMKMLIYKCKGYFIESKLNNGSFNI